LPKTGRQRTTEKPHNERINNTMKTYQSKVTQHMSKQEIQTHPTFAVFCQAGYNNVITVNCAEIN